MRIHDARLWKRIGGDQPFGVRLLTLALLVGGAIGCVGNLFPPGLWVWPMALLAHRFLAAAAMAYVVGSLLTLTRRDWAASELLLATVVCYGLPLVAAIAMQPEAINWRAPITWAFVIVVTPALLIALPALWRNRRRGAAERNGALTRGLRRFCLVLGSLALSVGVFVYVGTKRAGVVWPWAALPSWTALDSRLIASMLMTIGAGALLVRHRDAPAAAQVFLAMIVAYAVVGSCGAALHAYSTPAFVGPDLIYIGVFVLVGALAVLHYPRGDASRLVNRRGQPRGAAL